MTLKQRIENALHQRNGFRYHHESWSPKLWNKSAQDIKEFLLDRFNTTLDIEEYYGAMALLYRTIPNKELLIEFKDSPQYLDKVGISIDSNETLKETTKTLNEIGKITEINQVKHVSTIQFEGE